VTRLVAFGDSYTQGTGLTEDMMGPALKKSSPLAWPQLTADLLGMECVNKGLGGIGCKAVACIVNEFDFQPDDIVVIMWPDRARWCVLPDTEAPKQHILHITPMEIDVLDSAKNYYETLYTDQDSDFMFTVWSTFADTLCKSKASRVIHTVNDSDACMATFREINPNLEWVKGFKEDHFSQLDAALDGHWGPIAHQNLSKRLAKYISG